MRATVAWLAVCVGLVLTLRADAATLTYPSGPPCDGLLQDCIAGAAPGDRIEIAATQWIDEDIVIDKSLTLAPAAGASPVLGNGPVTRTLSIVAGGSLGGSTGPVSTIDVTVTGLTLNNVTIPIALLDGQDHHVEIDQVRLTHAVNSSDAAGIDVDVRTPATVFLHRNVITTTGKPIRVFSSLTDGTAQFTVMGNVVTTSNSGLSSSGIAVDARGSGTTRTDVYSNVVYNVSGCNCANASGIDIAAFEAADATVNVINNTLDQAKAIQVRTPSFSSRLLVNVFNNIVTGASNDPVRFPTKSLNLNINHGSNDLVKKNGVPGDFGGYSEGNEFNLDPRYVGGGNYRLRSNSPVIDIGTTNPAGGLPSEDADGNARFARLSTDMGAYEYGAPRAGSTTTSTTSTTVTTLGNGSTTTTTLPGAGCGPIPTFDSVQCRLDALTAVTKTDLAGSSLRDAVVDTLIQAALDSRQAADQVTPTGHNGPARASLGRAMRSLIRFEARLRSRGVKKVVSTDLRKTLRASSQGIRRDMGLMRRNLQ